MGVDGGLCEVCAAPLCLAFLGVEKLTVVSIDSGSFPATGSWLERERDWAVTSGRALLIVHKISAIEGAGSALEACGTYEGMGHHSSNLEMPMSLRRVSSRVTNNGVHGVDYDGSSLQDAILMQYVCYE